MLWAGPIGDLEVRVTRRGGAALRGRFPYERNATLTDGGRRGRPKKERFKSRAFSYRVEKPEEEIHLLSGHRYDKPLASRTRGTLELEDADDALSFEARIAPELGEVTWVRDVLATLDAGLAVGISPGFRIPPEQTVPDAEEVMEEDPREGRALIRVISAALLYELSIVTRPAYEEATVEQVEARSWEAPSTPPCSVPMRWNVGARWRR